jgi:hypothetical protein
LRVFVSSTLGELAGERRAVARAISALRLTPVMFELGARPYPPQAVFQQYLAQSDVFIGVYWQRYGQLVPGGHVSGLEEEFELSGGLPRLLYVKAPAPDRESRLADLLARIQAEASASYRHFRTPAELGGAARRRGRGPARRVGLPAWPNLRPVEADLVTRVRHRLGDSQFDQAFSAGSGLSQQEAVAIVRDQRGTSTP